MIALSEFNEKMLKKYPEMFLYEHSHFWGFEIGSGWYSLVENLVDTIDRYQRPLVRNGKAEFIHIEQIKEKFGGLRFYYSGGDEYVAGAVDFAERLSYSLCQDCGAPGLLRSGSWLRTLCDLHTQTRAAAKVTYPYGSLGEPL